MRPEIIRKNLNNDEREALIKCPGCDEKMFIDRDQFKGKVSIDCPYCNYHETYDLRHEH